MADLPRRSAAFALGGLLISAGFAAGLVTGHHARDQAEPRAQSAFGIVAEARERIRSAAERQVTDADLADGAVRGMLAQLADGSARFYTADGFRDLRDGLHGRFTGVGLWLRQRDGSIEVTTVPPGTPAARAGVCPGDVLEAVDGRAAAGRPLETVVGWLKGAPGSVAALTLRRDGRAVALRVRRMAISVPSVESRPLQGRVGYVRLFEFGRGSGEEVRRAVEGLRARGVTGVVLDLRDNPGGLLPEAVDVASVFLPPGPVTSYQERGRAPVVYSTRGPPVPGLSLAVLVNRGSASASEIVAGAVADRARGVVVGTPTHGKGTVQQVFDLGHGRGMTLTVASYRTPKGRTIPAGGLVPDVVIEGSPKVQLKRAEGLLHEILADLPDRAVG